MSSSSQRSREIDDDDQRKDNKEGIDQNAASGTADSIVLEEDLDPNYIPESTESKLITLIFNVILFILMSNHNINNVSWRICLSSS